MRRDVYYYFQQACRRNPDALPPPQEYVVTDDARAGFFLDIVGDRIEAAGYRCTTCMTLVALCEHVAQDLAGKRLDEVSAYTAEHLLDLHPEVPASRRERAYLAIAAARSALTSEHLST